MPEEFESSEHTPPPVNPAEEAERSNDMESPDPGGSISSSTPPAPSPVEMALICLATAARVAGLPADPEALCRAFPSRDVNEIPIILLRAAKKIGLKAKKIETSLDRHRSTLVHARPAMTPGSRGWILSR